MPILFNWEAEDDAARRAALRGTMCQNCGQRIPEDQAHDYPRANSYGSYICQRCSENHRQCQICLAWECACCVVNAVDDPRQRNYCLTCASDRLTHCVSCGDWYRHATEWDEYCDNCRPSYWDEDDDRWDEDGDQLINSWDYTPRLTFHGAGPTFLGMELEVSVAGDRGDAAEAALQHGDEIYLKSDSSIDYGFEMVTHPCSHEHFRTEFDWSVLDDLASRGCDGHPNGIHVHVSRDGFDSPAHVYRWMRLIYRNQRQVTAIARRNPNQWGSFDSHDPRRFKDYAKGSKRGERYSAINVQNNNTFEVRVFRGSLDKQEVMAALDLVAASVEYTRNLTVPAILAGGWTWDGFMTWVKEDGRYPALVAESDLRVRPAPAPRPTPERPAIRITREESNSVYAHLLSALRTA